jgi:ABC-2 type transport system permease protein
MTALDVSTTAPTPLARLVRVELRKARDTRAGFWLLTTIAALVLVAETLLVIVTAVQDQDEAIKLGDFIGVAAFITSILLPVLGIMLVTAEWTQRTAMVTFSLEPRRPRVVLAKLLTGIALTFVTAAVAVALGVLCTLLATALGTDTTWELGWNYLLGFLILQSFAMLGGFALAALLLNTPAALVVFFAYKWVVPGLLIVATNAFDWFEHIGPYVNLLDAQEPLTDLTLNTGEEWAHLLVSAALWLGLPLAIGVRRILRAEVK